MLSNTKKTLWFFGLYFSALMLIGLFHLASHWLVQQLMQLDAQSLLHFFQ